MSDIVRTSTAPPPVGAYPHARRVGELVYLSGIGPRPAGSGDIPGVVRDANGEVVDYDMEAQCRAVFENVRSVLNASGSAWKQLVDVTVFLTDIKRDFEVYNRLYAEYFTDAQPCRTTVEISRLPTPIAIELKCIATVLPEEKAMRKITSPFNFSKWIDEHREFLRPPVCNRQVFHDSEFIIMVVGGPNSRKDFHWDEGEEFFYQLEGEMLLKTVQDGKAIDYHIGEGEIFLLPPRIPHSPQRFANTVGLVIERQRRPGELDGFIWYCDNCNNKLHEEFVQLEDIVTQLPPLFDRFYSDPKHRSCGECGEIMPLPAAKT